MKTQEMNNKVIVRAKELLTIPQVQKEYQSKENEAEACYDPATVLGEDWNGTALDILDHPQIPSEDKIWAVCAKGALPESVQRLMAVAFVRKTPLHDGRNVVDLSTDERSLKALGVAELHALGRATDGELDAARYAAKAWARAATMAGAWDAAWAAAGDTSEAAAWDAQVEIARRVILLDHAE